MWIWLDDIRNPKDYRDPDIYPNDGDWVWVKNLRELKKLLEATGEPIEVMSFDHDLGSNEPSGYDVIKWLAENSTHRYPAETRVHSANPVGAENIRAYDRNVRKYLL